jgi:hypothetical protein
MFHNSGQKIEGENRMLLKVWSRSIIVIPRHTSYRVHAAANVSKADLCEDIFARGSLSTLSDLGECNTTHSGIQVNRVRHLGRRTWMHAEWKRYRDTAPFVLDLTA